MSALVSSDIVNLQDIEHVQFLQALQADPAKYQAYIQERTGRILSEVVDTKRASYVKVSGDMARSMDMDHNSLAALYRTDDLAAAQKQILTEQSQFISNKHAALDQSRRQVEINNWYFENKRETLFVLQIALLVLLMVVLFLAATAQGFMSETLANYGISIVVVSGGLVWLYNWYYTRWIRDRRYWSQRTFADDGKHVPNGGHDVCVGTK